MWSECLQRSCILNKPQGRLELLSDKNASLNKHEKNSKLIFWLFIIFNIFTKHVSVNLQVFPNLLSFCVHLTIQTDNQANGMHDSVVVDMMHCQLRGQGSNPHQRLRGRGLATNPCKLWLRKWSYNTSYPSHGAAPLVLLVSYYLTSWTETVRAIM